MFPLAAFPAFFDRGMPLRAPGPADLPARQQTLSDTLSWSYSLLGPGDQALFRWLSCCPSWSMEAMRAVCGADKDDVDQSQALGRLVNLNLVRCTADAAASVRIWMLETVREFGRELSRLQGEEDDQLESVCSYFAEFVERIEPELKGPFQGQRIAQLHCEHDNVRSALGWAIRSSRLELALRLAAGMWRFWIMNGHLGEGRQWLDEVLRAARSAGIASAPDRPEPWKHLYAKVAHGAALVAYYQGDYATAKRLGEDSLALRRALGDTAAVSHSLNNLAMVAAESGDSDGAREQYLESLALKRGLGDRHGIASTLNNLGLLLAGSGDASAAVLLYEESLELWREVGDDYSVARSLANLGEARQMLGDMELAARHLDQSLSLRRWLGGREGIAHTLALQGDLAQRQHDAATAIALYMEACELYRDVGATLSLLLCINRLAAALSDERLHDLAALLVSGAQAVLSAEGLSMSQTDLQKVEQVLGVAHAALGDEGYRTTCRTGERLTLEALIAQAVRCADEYWSLSAAAATASSRQPAPERRLSERL